MLSEEWRRYEDAHTEGWVDGAIPFDRVVWGLLLCGCEVRLPGRFPWKQSMRRRVKLVVVALSRVAAMASLVFLISCGETGLNLGGQQEKASID